MRERALENEDIMSSPNFYDENKGRRQEETKKHKKDVRCQNECQKIVQLLLSCSFSLCTALPWACNSPQTLIRREEGKSGVGASGKGARGNGVRSRWWG